MPKSARMTPAMRKALESARDKGTPTAHLRGMSDWGGWGVTREALFRRGWLSHGDFKITDAGRKALAESQ
jgi:hypothetical protein